MTKLNSGKITKTPELLWVRLFVDLGSHGKRRKVPYTQFIDVESGALIKQGYDAIRNAVLSAGRDEEFTEGRMKELEMSFDNKSTESISSNRKAKDHASISRTANTNIWIKLTSSRLKQHKRMMFISSLLSMVLKRQIQIQILHHQLLLPPMSNQVQVSVRSKVQ